MAAAVEIRHRDGSPNPTDTESFMRERDPNIISSSLSGVITRDGVTIRLEIHRLDHDPKWALEVVNEAGTSTVWDELFDSNEAAYAAFEQAVEEEGMRAFLDEGNIIPFPTRH